MRFKKEQSGIRETLTVSGLDDGQQHYDDAEKGAKLTYLLLVLCVLTLFSLKFKPLWFARLAWATFVS